MAYKRKYLVQYAKPSESPIQNEINDVLITRSSHPSSIINKLPVQLKFQTNQQAQQQKEIIDIPHQQRNQSRTSSSSETVKFKKTRYSSSPNSTSSSHSSISSSPCSSSWSNSLNDENSFSFTNNNHVSHTGHHITNLNKKISSAFSYSSQSSNSSSSVFLGENLAKKISLNSMYSITENNETHSLNIKSKFPSKFFSNLSIYLNTVPYDICIMLDNNESINAHKIILINSSNYFRRRIKMDNNISFSANSINNNRFDIDILKLKGIDVDFDCLKTCIDFMYSGGAKFKIRMDNAHLLKKTASFMELGDLVKICSYFEQYFSSLNNSSQALSMIENCSQNFDTADLHKSINYPPKNGPVRKSNEIEYHRKNSPSNPFASTLQQSQSFNSLEQLSMAAAQLQNNNHMFTLPNSNCILNQCRNNSNSFDSLVQEKQQLQHNNYQFDEPINSSPSSSLLQINSNNAANNQSTTSNNIIQKFLENYYKNSSELVNLMVKQEFVIEEKDSENNEKLSNNTEIDKNKTISSNEISNEKGINDLFDKPREVQDSVNDNKQFNIEEASLSNDSSDHKSVNSKSRLTFTEKKASSLEKINVEGHILFDDPSIFKKLSIYFKNLKQKLDILSFQDASEPSLKEVYKIEIEPINRDFSIKNKYIYPSMLKINNEKQINDLLSDFIECHSLIKLEVPQEDPSIRAAKNEFDRDTLLIFCLNISDGEAIRFKFNNYLIKLKLVFTELDVLKGDIKKVLDEFLNTFLIKRIKHEYENNFNYTLESLIERVCYLKKPSNCKTIRLEQIRSSTDCFRAMVEFSRRNEVNEKPFIFVTCHANIYLNKT